MRDTTNSKVRQKGMKRLRCVFNTLRVRDGLTEKAEADEFIYWYNKSRDGEYGNYIIYAVIDSAATYRADDIVAARNFSAQVDVFSTWSFESERLTVFLESLEGKLVKAGFTVEMPMEEYEPDTRLYHAVFIVIALIA